jgi:hypothetical protein
MGPRYDAGDPVCGHTRLICAAGLIPLTVPAIKQLLAALLTRPHPPGHAGHWLDWNAATKPAPAGTTSAPG